MMNNDKHKTVEIIERMNTSFAYLIVFMNIKDKTNEITDNIIPKKGTIDKASDRPTKNKRSKPFFSLLLFLSDHLSFSLQ